MGEHLKETNSQSINHMLSEAPWDYQDLFEGIFNRAYKLLKSHKKKVYLLVDEVGVRKKGTESACVSRQYLGCIGKSDNGQVAVVAALNSEDFYAPVSIELFMSKDWEKDKVRRTKTKIPDSIKHRTKIEMALEVILKLYKKIKPLEYVVFDALYGSAIGFLNVLIKKKIPFVGDIKENATIYLSLPKMAIPENSGRGRKSSLPKPNKKGISILNYQQSLKKYDYQKLDIRQGTKGMLKAYYHRIKVWVMNNETQEFLEVYLLIRKNIDGSFQYAVGYNPVKSTIIEMAKAQAQRVFVERVFEEGKNIVGMADYQVRSWDGFHRHMALCSLCLLFIMEQKILLAHTVGKVTGYQLQELINATILVIGTKEEIIHRLIKQIPRYQREIMKNNRRFVT
jgi:SRSO17 transposase